MEDYTEFEIDELDFDDVVACASCGEVDELDFVDVGGFAADVGTYHLR